MLHRTLAATLAATFLATATLAQEPTTVREVDVEVDLGAIANPAAATYWTNVADDLENAIVARITDRTDPEGVRIPTDIEEVSLASPYEYRTESADTHLIGQDEHPPVTAHPALNPTSLSARPSEALTYPPPRPGPKPPQTAAPGRDQGSACAAVGEAGSADG